MMHFWQVDAFTKELFTGNPAAVFIFEEEPHEELMQKIAQEMNLSETAFVIQRPELRIRWFAPNRKEGNLCGHATLSAAHIMWEKGFTLDSEITFQSKSGPLVVRKMAEKYQLDFPLQPSVAKPQYKEQLTQLLGVEPHYIGSNGEACMAILLDDSLVYAFTPDILAIAQLEERGFFLSARDQSGKHDYIYRAFFPKLGASEDPVTGKRSRGQKILSY